MKIDSIICTSVKCPNVIKNLLRCILQQFQRNTCLPHPFWIVGSAKRANTVVSRESARAAERHVIFTQRNGDAEGVSVVGSVCFWRVFFAKFSSSRHMDQQSVSVYLA